MNTPKYLIILDFDHTLIKQESYAELVQMLKDKDIHDELSQSSHDWNLYNRLLFSQLKEEGIDYGVIKQKLETLELNTNFKQLLAFLQENEDLFHVIIVSGSINIIIEWVLEYNGFSGLVKNIYSHKARKGSTDDFVKFVENERRSCDICQYALCKAVIIADILAQNNFTKIFYVGDGLNDYCAALKLREDDILYPRKDFALHKKICTDNNHENLECDVCDWEHALTIVEHIKSNICK
jgi:2,3-diketo-5-methylthio-1-phosphopentane phosphatase